MKEIMDSDFIPQNNEEMTPGLAEKIANLKEENKKAQEKKVAEMGISIPKLQVESIEKVVNNLKKRSGGLGEVSLEELKQIKDTIEKFIKEIKNSQGLSIAESAEHLEKLQTLKDEIEEAKDKKIKSI